MIVELQRQLRRRRTLYGLLGIAALPVLLAIAFLLSTPEEAAGIRPACSIWRPLRGSTSR